MNPRVAENEDPDNLEGPELTSSAVRYPILVGQLEGRRNQSHCAGAISWD